VAEASPAGFATTWSLTGVTILGPNTVSALGRNDQINLFDAGGNLVDRLSYGDESFPGSVRARERSGQLCTNALGSDDAILWVLSTVGDAYGSVTSFSGDIGSPGTHGYVSCNWAIGTSYCIAGVNVSGTTALISATGSTAVADEDVTLNVAGANPGVFGIFLFGATQAQIPFGTGYRCVGGVIQRIYPPILVGLGGDVTKPLDFNAPYAALLAPGSTQNFQFWYRDGSSFNFSDGVRVDFH